MLFRQIYGEPEVKKEEEKKDGNEEGEDKKEDDDQIVEKPKPQKKKGKNPEDLGKVHVYKLKRGGKKVICLISGLEYYTKDLKSLASKFGKKFSCGCNIAQDDIYGEVISVQGDVEDKLLDLLEQDKEMQALKVPSEKIIFEDKGNKKGRKKN